MNGDDVCRKIRELLAKTPDVKESKLNAYEDIRWLLGEWDEYATAAQMNEMVERLSDQPTWLEDHTETP